MGFDRTLMPFEPSPKSYYATPARMKKFPMRLYISPMPCFATGKVTKP